MFIQKITWLDHSCLEAELVVSDGSYCLLCFSCPCEYAVGDELRGPLECLDAQDICVAEENVFNVVKGPFPYSYTLCGRICDISKGIVCVGKLKLHIEQNRIPKDIRSGQYVWFSTSRIDIY